MSSNQPPSFPNPQIHLPSPDNQSPEGHFLNDPEMSSTPRRVSYTQVPTSPNYEDKSPPIGGFAFGKGPPTPFMLHPEDQERLKGYRHSTLGGFGGVDPTVHDGPELRQWIPLPLENWAMASLIAMMLIGCVVMEVLLWWSNHTKGWPTLSQTADFGAIHFLYTIPPVAISLPVVAMWAWIDMSIKKLQPYIDLTAGDATAEKTLFLNYLDTNRFIVWYYTLRNKHYLATLSTAIALFTLLVSPVASGLFVVRETYIIQPNQAYNSQDNLALNPNYTNLVAFSSAAGFMQAKAMYNVTQPSFTKGNWTIAQFQLPENPKNGTATAATVAIQTDPNCVPADLVSITSSSSTSLTAFATYQGCTQNYTFNLGSLGTATVFGSGLFDCSFSNGTTMVSLNGGNRMIGKVAFWVFDVENDGTSGYVAVCDPSMKIHNATAAVDLATKALINATAMNEITGNGNTVTGSPINGKPFNGLGFNLQGADGYIIGRANATTTGLATAIFQTVQQSPGGLNAAWDNGAILNITNQLYTTFLGLVASKVYFTSTENLSSGQSSSTVIGTLGAWQSRLWVAPQAAHILAGAFAALALAGTVLAVLHNKARANLRLPHEPGTIASTAAMTGHTQVGIILEGKDDERTMRRLLSQHRFRIDPDSGKIVFDGEYGFENAISPSPAQLGFRDGPSSTARGGGTPPISPNPNKNRFSKILSPLGFGKKDSEMSNEDAIRLEEHRQMRLARLESFKIGPVPSRSTETGEP